MMNEIKSAVTKYPVLDIIKNRWSPRSFSDRTVTKNDINTILEAATWSFSAMNEQPWRFVVAIRGTELFNAFFDTLFPGNQPWNKKAAVLILTLNKKYIGEPGKINESALHDIGAANMLMTLQANSMGIYTHLMEGFSKEKAANVISLSEDLEPVVMIAVGYPGHATDLAEPFKSRELAPRKRLTLDKVVLSLN